jgi:hypothetical protein
VHRVPEAALSDGQERRRTKTPTTTKKRSTLPNRTMKKLPVSVAAGAAASKGPLWHWLRLVADVFLLGW